MSGKKPLMIVFAGPNGSGKTTFTDYLKFDCEYINADNIKASTGCTDYEATTKAYARRLSLIEQHKDFAFETVLSSKYNLDLLKKAKENGYFIKCYYVLTCDPIINVSRVKTRVGTGGHGVPEDKTISRYYKCLKLLPEVVELCDIIHIYDNSETPVRIFKKKHSEIKVSENSIWSEKKIKTLVGIE